MIKLLYATFASKEEAVSVAHKLLVEKLIACANILDGSTSIYKWENKVQQQKEAILFAKTTDKQAQKAIARTKELHSYDLPCVLILPVEAGLPAFMNWVEAEAS